MKNRTEVLDYAKSVHLAINGEALPIEHRDCSDHPYEGHSTELIQELVNGDLVKSQVRAFDKGLKSEMDEMYKHLLIDTPVKVTKGSKDKRGIEGFILHAKEPLQGSGKALFVYDVLTHKSCMVRNSATKVRVPKPGERDLLRETYRVCETLAPHFTTGKNVSLKSDPIMKGFILTDAQKNPNLEGKGFHQVQVQWQSGEQTAHILTELNLIN
tara:strand:- start:25 stop:663 length:639 start_codon:yes stop_codon:yes gene_type:complete